MTRIFVYVFRQVLLIRGTRGASSVVNLVWLSPPIVERVTVSPGPILSSFFIVTRCRGILVRSCDPRDTFNEDAGSSYVWTFLFFSLSLSLPFLSRGIRTEPCPASPFSSNGTSSLDFVPFPMQILRLKVPGKSRGTLEREWRKARLPRVTLIKMYALSSIGISPPPDGLARSWNSMGAACAAALRAPRG